VLGGIYIYRLGQHEQGAAEYERAIALNPNHADILAGWGWALTVLGRAEEAVETIRRAMRLNPYYPDWYKSALGDASYLARQYNEAVDALERVENHTVDSRLILAASYAQLGRLNDARAEATRAFELQSDLSIKTWSEYESYNNPADIEHIRDGLRKAGLLE
ncbi:MAG: tetratricopeptide repeat protein, partial [Gammaproteobacteria bacterium]